MPKATAMQIANAIADKVNEHQKKKSKPPKAKAVEEPSVNEGKSGSAQARPDDAKSDDGTPITGLSKPMPNKKPQRSGTVQKPFGKK